MMALVVDTVGVPEAYQGVVLSDGGVEIYQSRIYEVDLDGDEAKSMALADAQDKLAEILSNEEEA